MSNIKVGHSFIRSDVFATYLNAVIAANQFAANFVERSHITAQLARAAMPADILGRMTVYEVAALPPALAEQTVRAISQRLAQVTRAENAPL